MGIMPDVFIPVDTARYTDYHRKLVASGLVNRVSMNYLDRNRNQMMAKYPKFQQYKQGFVVGEDIMEELLKMAGDEKIEFEEEQYNRSKPLIMLQIKALTHGISMIWRSTSRLSMMIIQVTRKRFRLLIIKKLTIGF